MDTTKLPDVSLPPADIDVAFAHAQQKRMYYPWNDWGRRPLRGCKHMPYAELLSSGAALVDAWADPAFVSPRTGTVGLWLRAEVWRHPDGTIYRTVLDAHGTIVAPLECCPRLRDLLEGILLPLTLVPPALQTRLEVTP